METKTDKKINRRSKTFLAQVDIHIIDLMTKGWTPSAIEQELIDNWDFSGSDNARKAIRRCNAKLADANKDTFENKCAKYLEMYHSLYKNAVDVSEYKTASGIMDSIVKLEGLLTTKIDAKVDSTSEVNLTNITDSKLEEIINKILIK